MSEPVIRTEGLVKEFPVASKTLGEPRKVLHAVTNVSLSVPKGGIFGIVGESGCGKSTLGRCLLRLETITKGSVFFQGRDITNLSGKDLLPLRKNMQMIFQNPYGSFDPKQKIGAALTEVAAVHKMDATQAQEKIHNLLEQINRDSKAVVQMTLTTLDDDLCRIIEPNVCPTSRRFEVLCELRERGIPTVVWLTPLLPFINDTEENVRGILELAHRAGCKGVMAFGMGLTLRDGSREYFYEALDRHLPGVKERYIKRYVNNYELPSPDTARLLAMFHEECARYGMMSDPDRIFAYLNEFPECEQLTLF